MKVEKPLINGRPLEEVRMIVEVDNPGSIPLIKFLDDKCEELERENARLKSEYEALESRHNGLKSAILRAANDASAPGVFISRAEITNCGPLLTAESIERVIRGLENENSSNS